MKGAKGVNNISNTMSETRNLIVIKSFFRKSPVSRENKVEGRGILTASISQLLTYVDNLLVVMMPDLAVRLNLPSFISREIFNDVTNCPRSGYKLLLIP